MTDWAGIAQAVALALLGKPSKRTSREWRWGRKGSLALNVERGSWFDHSSGEGGGVLALVKRERNCDQAAALRWLREQSYLADDGPGRRPNKPRERTPQRDGHPEASAVDERPRHLWNTSERSDGSPAHVYLARRLVWPPAGEGCPPLPEAVRWLTRQAWERERWRWFRPPEADGALVCAYRDRGGELVAVSLEALNAEGRRVNPRWRQTYGSRKGAAFRPVPRPEAVKVILAEGDLDALAGGWLYRGADVLGVGGTSGLMAWEPWDERPILACPDGDKEGDAAAHALLTRLGLDCVSVDWRARGDLADDLAVRIGERAAIMEHDGGLRRSCAERLAWEGVSPRNEKAVE